MKLGPTKKTLGTSYYIICQRDSNLAAANREQKHFISVFPPLFTVKKRILIDLFLKIYNGRTTN